VYYEYKPSKAKPLLSPKKSHEISEALRNFQNELPHFISDRDAMVSIGPAPKDENSIVVVVETTLTEAEMDEAVKRCLDGLDLLGEKLERI
jgi:hypothetical protein